MNCSIWIERTVLMARREILVGDDHYRPGATS